MKKKYKPTVRLTPKLVQNAGLLPEEVDGYTVFTKREDEDFKILQLTDLHLGCGPLTKNKDVLAKNAVIKVVEAVAPDLIIVTGDNVYPIPLLSGTTNNMKQTKVFCELMSGFGIPWAFVFGNHDEEKHSPYTKEQLADYAMKQPNCLFKKGEDGITGVGNYCIKLNHADGSLNMALMLIDSNMYESKGFTSGFDVIHDDQIDWYKKEIEKLSENGRIVPSLAFFHIPPAEFKEGWTDCYLGGNKAVYHNGFVGEKDNYFGHAKRLKGNFFEEMVKLGSTKGMFMGHDHLSTLSLTYKGIRLTYGMSIDYLAYLGIHKRHTQRGGTLITVGNNGVFDVKPIPLGGIK